MARKIKAPTLDQVIKILDNPRTVERHILINGAERPEVITRIAILYPRDGAGTLRVCVSDWGADGKQEVRHHIGKAGGYGYDKLAAALSGATVGGVELGDHCDPDGRPTLDQVVSRNPWRLV